ncbi:hypothetical protein OXB_2877 [Bacillus sp. OxB-1]|uniref:hypothetical protein n=1 Tax=Bacillus sp. (strain OxB-1) TaxID=98228 RepID=UPI00058205A6|nr:hypothetical protein [Bacillus sp. OxB-1]BAQ11348.1 hypothetical protein OXB_2877 [Bacillus sp. OxB-1]
MGEYADLIAKGVYCKKCGCYTGQEPGCPTLCNGCVHELHEIEIENAIERGEEI